MSSKREVSVETGGPSFLLFLLFLGLKLGHVIAWSWWLVTLPLWGSLALLVVGLVLAAIITAGIHVIRG